MSIIDTLVYDRIPGATYDWRDFNRVAEAMEYVAERLRACGWSIEVTPQRFVRTDKPTPPVVTYYLDQLRKLRDTLTLSITTPPVPGVTAERDWMTVQEANDIEKILADIDQLLTNAAAAFRHCGAAVCGGGGLLIL